MAVNETIVTGRKWRRCIDVANKLWQRISYWTKASDVEFDDGQTAENKMGAISGITSDLNGESENIAASIKVVNQLNNNLKQFCQYSLDYNNAVSLSIGATQSISFTPTIDGFVFMSGYGAADSFFAFGCKKVRIIQQAIGNNYVSLCCPVTKNITCNLETKNITSNRTVVFVPKND